MLLCTLLHSRKTQLFYFQWIPHSLRETTRGVGRGSHVWPESARGNYERPVAAGQAGALLTPALGLHDDFRPAGEDRGGEAAARSEFAADDAPFGANGGDDVAQHFIDGVFVEDAEAAVGEEIHFQSFQLEAIFFRHVLDGDGAEVGETRLGTDGGVFGKACGDDVAGKLIRPSLKRGQ